MKQLSTTGLEPVRGSLLHFSQSTNKPLAKVILGVSAVVIFDSSASMGLPADGGGTRYESAIRELNRIQAEIPGKIAVVSFGESVKLCVDGVPAAPTGGTALTEALEFCRIFDAKPMRFVLIGDGSPNNPETALATARLYRNKIDSAFIGRGGGSGESFLMDISAVSGGEFTGARQASELFPVMRRLISSH